MHEYGYKIDISSDGEFRFVAPTGSILPAVPARLDRDDLGWPAILDANAELDITAATAACGWTGDPVDYHLCLEALVAAEEGRIRGPI
ncbi:MAG: hypothetical protein H0V17_28910 [Deltaproteobacteria bacterium]|nr:hypothetical protein [Deltaproteobacteria bacterium]